MSLEILAQMETLVLMALAQMQEVLASMVTLEIQVLQEQMAIQEM